MCATKTPLRTQTVTLQTGSGNLPAQAAPTNEANEATAPPLPIGPYRPPRQAPTQVPLPSGAASAASAHASVSDLAVDFTELLPTNFPASSQRAREPSVAMAGGVVMYTFNWSAGYSVDGGQHWTGMDPRTTLCTKLPHTSTCASGSFTYCCDQVVIYDPVSDRFIWVVQYNADAAGENIIRVAYASPTNLARYGSGAWSWFDLPSGTLAGAGNFLDQPRLSLTPQYLYMNINQAKGRTVTATVLVRIARAGFANPGGPSDYGYALIDTTSTGDASGAYWSYRVAQNPSGPTEYFVGHRDTSTLGIVSIDDNANYALVQTVPDQTIADQNWPSLTPGGDDMEGRQASSQRSQITGVTQDSSGNLWVAWSEGRDIFKNGSQTHVTGQPTQPHIAIAELAVNHPKEGPAPAITLSKHYVDWNATYALAMPDLATTASGDVAMVFDWGGGSPSTSASYENQDVGFLSGPAGTNFVDQGVASGTSDPDTDQTIDIGNPAGDYGTVRPDAPPYGDCLIAAGVVNQGKRVGYPVFTMFSRPGATCPKFRSLPFGPPPTTATQGPSPSPSPSPKAAPQSTTLTLNCPNSVATGSQFNVSGTLSPGINNAPIAMSYSLPDGSSSSDTVYTDPDSSGNFRDSAPASNQTGTETVHAHYAGDGAHAASDASCQVMIEVF